MADTTRHIVNLHDMWSEYEFFQKGKSKKFVQEIPRSYRKHFIAQTCSEGATTKFDEYVLFKKNYE